KLSSGDRAVSRWFGQALRLLPLEHDQYLFILLVGGEPGRAILGLATVLEADLQFVPLDLVNPVQSLALERDVQVSGRLLRISFEGALLFLIFVSCAPYH